MKSGVFVIYMYGYPAIMRELSKTLEICFCCGLYYRKMNGNYEEG